jgi:hypothetical protein
MHAPKPLNALAEPVAPGLYWGWKCPCGKAAIKVFTKEQFVDAAPSEFVELYCKACKKTSIHPWNERQPIEELPPVT